MLLATREDATVACDSPLAPPPRAAGRAEPQAASATAAASQTTRDETIAGSGTPQPTARLLGKGPWEGPFDPLRASDYILSVGRVTARRRARVMVTNFCPSWTCSSNMTGPRSGAKVVRLMRTGSFRVTSTTAQPR